jgi:hypothetical protein
MTTKLEEQIKNALTLLPTSKPKHFIVRPARPKGGKARHGKTAAHRLQIHSLHDAQADCSCGGWYYLFTGARTKQQVEEAFRLHLWKPRKGGGKSRHGGFARLEGTLKKRPDVRDPGALASWIGRKKLGKRKFQKRAAVGRKRAARR